MAEFNYSINISTYDCTGCEVCVESCPDDAITMKFIEEADEFTPNWDYAISLPNKKNPYNKFTVKGS